MGLDALTFYRTLYLLVSISLVTDPLNPVNTCFRVNCFLVWFFRFQNRLPEKDTPTLLDLVKFCLSETKKGLN